MNNLNNDQLSSGCQTDQNSYIPPEITVLEINLEQGFSASSASGTEEWNKFLLLGIINLYLLIWGYGRGFYKSKNNK